MEAVNLERKMKTQVLERTIQDFQIAVNTRYEPGEAVKSYIDVTKASKSSFYRLKNGKATIKGGLPSDEAGYIALYKFIYKRDDLKVEDLPDVVKHLVLGGYREFCDNGDVNSYKALPSEQEKLQKLLSHSDLHRNIYIMTITNKHNNPTLTRIKNMYGNAGLKVLRELQSLSVLKVNRYGTILPGRVRADYNKEAVSGFINSMISDIGSRKECERSKIHDNEIDLAWLMKYRVKPLSDKGVRQAMLILNEALTAISELEEGPNMFEAGFVCKSNRLY
ncbi:hypothetical protein [Halobacteriovorax sp. CON-3]|uniref:hypothetical protein n=1 Tax=Halobacteriovorax sp. CON-3 TaxID=3157710 RepID=UPI003718F400